jgi:acyl carrier protein
LPEGAEVTRDEIRGVMSTVLEGQGKAPPANEAQTTRELGFRSLDLSEVALRVELQIGRELNFEAVQLRAIETVGDVLDFLEEAVAA